MNIFVVIRAGHEGIEGLLYASVNKNDAIEEVRKLRKVIIHDKAHREAVLQDSEEGDWNEDAWDRLYYDEKIDDETHANGAYEDPDAICIQEWDGKEFKCVCADLDVAPTETWLM